MGTKAKQTIARRRRLLRTIGRRCGHVVSRPHDGTWHVTVQDLLTEDHKLNRHYGPSGQIDKDTLLHDLRLLAEDDLISFQTATGAQDTCGSHTEGAPTTWLTVLKTGGLEHLVELEKSWIRRAYEKNPPAWWMVALTLVATAVAVIALLKSYGVI